MNPTMELETLYCADICFPLPLVLARAEGACVRDEVACADGLIDRAVARIQQVLDFMKPRRLAF